MKSHNSKLATGLILLGLSAGVFAADAGTMQEAINGATVSGQFRFGYITNDADVSGTNTTSAAAIGGQLKFETATWKRLQFAIAPYFSEKIEALSGDEQQNKLNSDFFDSNNDSFAYLGEAYVNYSWSAGTLRVGRQQLDNPFINTDDIRMLPNTFNAAWLSMLVNGNLALEAGKVSTWAGLGSGGDQNKFKRASNDGVLALGATYKMKDHHTFQAWYYDFDRDYSQIYLQAIYANGPFEAGMQYTDYSEDNTASTTDGSAWGLSAAYDFGVVKASVSINEASNAAGKSVSDGLGGGNFFTSMDDTTIAGMTDASAYMLSIEYPASQALTLAAAWGHFEDGSKTSNDQDELNLILGYRLNKQLEISFTRTTVDNNAAPADAGTNFTRNLLLARYSF